MNFVNCIALFFCFASMIMISNRLDEIDRLLIRMEKQSWLIYKHAELSEIMKSCHQDIIDHPEFYLDMPQ